MPAAGSGERLGQGPKALVRLGEETLLQLAIRAVLPLVDQVLVALPPGFAAPPGIRSVMGGSTRQASVRALLEATEADIVLIHDVARPFLPHSVGIAVLRAATLDAAATASLPVADTLFSSLTGSGVSRDSLHAIQTPQAFRRELLQQAHEAATDTATDDATLVRQLGHPVRLVTGSPWLFKVTHQADLDFARLLLPAWQELA